MVPVMCIKTEIRLTAAPLPSGGGWQPKLIPPPLSSEFDDDNDALRAPRGVMISVFIGTLWWLVLYQLGIF